MSDHYYIAQAPQGERQHLVARGYNRSVSGWTQALCPTEIPKRAVRVNHGLHPARWWRHRFEAELCHWCWEASRKERAHA